MQDMRKSRLSRSKQAKLIEHFVAGTTARRAASLIGVDKMTAAYYFQRLREIIALQTTGESNEAFDGEIELDESYFGRKGKRGRGAKGKVAVFGLLRRGGKVYAKVIPDAASATLMPIIEKKSLPTALSIPTAGRATTRWMCPGSSTTGSTIPFCSPTRKTISTGLRTSGTGQAPLAQIQWYSQGVFSAILEGVRMAIQQPVATGPIHAVKAMG